MDNKLTGNGFSYIDCHTHLIPTKRLRKLMEWTRTFMPDHPVPLDITVEGVIDDLRRSGAKRWVNLLYPVWEGESRELNRFGAKLADQYSEITTFAGVHITDRDPLAVTREAIEELGLYGLKFHPMVQRFSPADPVFESSFSFLEEKEKALYLHTGFDEWYGYTFPLVDIERIVSNYPDLAVVLSHFCFPHLDRAFDLAGRFPNVWLDLTNVFGTLSMMKQGDDTPLVNPDMETGLSAVLEKRLPGIAHRVIFGTDHPAGMGDLELIFSDMSTFNIDDGTLEQVLQKTPNVFLDRYGRQ